MIVVTGAAGFIGSNIVADLEAAGRGPIAVADWFGTADQWRNLAKRTIMAFVDPEQIIAFLEANAHSIKAVIHMGAISSTTERDVDLLVTFNIRSSVSLWDWCAKARVPFIYASSAATYGAMEAGFKDNEDPASLAALRPLNAYGWSKKAVDEIFAGRIAAGDPAPPQWVGLKFFNVFGPNEYHKGEMRSVVAKLFETVQAGRPIRLFKSYRADIPNGQQRRDFVYVKDCSHIVLWLLDHPEVSGIFNLGTGTTRSFLDIARTLLTCLGKPMDVEFIDMPEELRAQYQYVTQADMTKLRSAGLKLAFGTLEVSIEDYLGRHLLKNDRYR